MGKRVETRRASTRRADVHKGYAMVDIGSGLHYRGGRYGRGGGPGRGAGRHPRCRGQRQAGETRPSEVSEGTLVKPISCRDEPKAPTSVSAQSVMAPQRGKACQWHTRRREGPSVPKPITGVGRLGNGRASPVSAVSLESPKCQTRFKGGLLQRSGRRRHTGRTCKLGELGH